MRGGATIARRRRTGSGNLAPTHGDPTTMQRAKLTATVSFAALLLLLALGAPARADEAAGRYNLALQLKREGKLPQAIAECEKAIALRPDYAAAHLTLGNLWRSQGNYQKAATEYEATVKLQ